MNYPSVTSSTFFSTLGAGSGLVLAGDDFFVSPFLVFFFLSPDGPKMMYPRAAATGTPMASPITHLGTPPTSPAPAPASAPTAEPTTW